jgi:hypothetical protein
MVNVVVQGNLVLAGTRTEWVNIQKYLRYSGFIVEKHLVLEADEVSRKVKEVLKYWSFGLESAMGEVISIPGNQWYSGYKQDVYQGNMDKYQTGIWSGGLFGPNPISLIVVTPETAMGVTGTIGLNSIVESATWLDARLKRTGNTADWNGFWTRLHSFPGRLIPNITNGRDRIVEIIDSLDFAALFPRMFSYKINTDGAKDVINRIVGIIARSGGRSERLVKKIIRLENLCQ